jgi:hypothetical protein
LPYFPAKLNFNFFVADNSAVLGKAKVAKYNVQLDHNTKNALIALSSPKVQYSIAWSKFFALLSLFWVCVIICISASSQPTVYELVFKATLDTKGNFS